MTARFCVSLLRVCDANVTDIMLIFKLEAKDLGLNEVPR